MTNEQKEMLLDLSKKTISNSITGFNDSLQKIDIYSSENNEVFENCKKILEDIENELDKAKKLVI